MAKKKVVKKASNKAKKVAKAGQEEKRPTPGVYVYKPLKSKILDCSCGNKFIATRPQQRTCFDCIREQALAVQ